MTKLSDLQRGLLTRAVQSDGAIEAPQEHKPAVTGLIRRGYFISVPQDDGPSRLMITDAGRAAIAGSVEGVAGGGRQQASPETGAANPPPSTTAPKGKIGILVRLLSRPEGATIATMMAETGWQAHSVRGAISGSIKKASGRSVISEQTSSGRTYRIVSGAKA